MNSFIYDHDDHIENFKTVTTKLYELPADFSLSNGWTRRELLIHLNSWDQEFVKLTKKALNGELKNFFFKFERLTVDERAILEPEFLFEHQEMDLEFTKWNDYKLEEQKEKTFKEVEELFKDTREKVIDLFEELAEKEKGNKFTSQILSLWIHDREHLEKGGVEITIVGKNEVRSKKVY
ncbi:MAG: hypothetical protein ACTSYA_10470 [Candidatus Kariarchaeaceae archaeon]